jgi:hypothetical protein
VVRDIDGWRREAGRTDVYELQKCLEATHGAEWFGGGQSDVFRRNGEMVGLVIAVFLKSSLPAFYYDDQGHGNGAVN